MTKRSRKNGGHKQHPFAMPKYMEADFTKSRRELLHHRRRRFRFAVPLVFDHFVQCAIVQVAAGWSVDNDFGNGPESSRQIIFLEMKFCFRDRGKRLGRV